MKPVPQEAIDNWKNCDINQMVHHFHKTENGQSTREAGFSFDPRIESEILGKGELDFRILMTFTTDTPKIPELSFRPEIQLLRNGEHMGMLTHHLGDHSTPAKVTTLTKEGSSPGAAKVPRDYKETVVRNWLSLENSQIDDVFMAHKTNLSDYTKTGLMRLMRYEITSSINGGLHKFLNENLGNGGLKRLTLHLGVDHNKRPLFGEYNFAPVLEFYMVEGSNPDLDISDFPGLSFSHPNGGGESVYFQYMNPCPPFGDCD